MMTIKVDNVDINAKKVFNDLKISEFINLQKELRDVTDDIQLMTITLSHCLGIKVEDFDNWDIIDVVTVFDELTKREEELSRIEFEDFQHNQSWEKYEDIKITKKNYDLIKSEIIKNEWKWIEKIPTIFFNNNEVAPDYKSFENCKIDVILPYILKILEVIGIQMKLQIKRV